MRITPLISALAALAMSTQAMAQQGQSVHDEADVPLMPGDAAGPWTLELEGHPVCVLNLGKEHTGKVGFGLKAPSSCGEVVPAGVTAWAPAGRGMNLVDSDGQVLLRFRRWSNSLFVTYHSTGANLSLKRGGPEG